MAEKDVQKSRSEDREQRQMTRRRYDPFASSLMPSEFFNMNPFSLMRRMQDEMDRMMSGASERAWSPAIEVSEREGELVVCAELPGVSKDDVKIEVTEGALTLEGERKQEQTEERGGYRRSERSYGRFYRAIPLPEGATVDNAKANFKDGVLEVRIPIEQPKSRSRQIQIEEQKR